VWRRRGSSVAVGPDEGFSGDRERVADALNPSPGATRHPLPWRGEGKSASRLLFGGLMLAALLLGVAAILRRDVPTRRAWMIRAYAMGLGATTQMLIFIPAGLALGRIDSLTNALLWASPGRGGAEWIIRRPAMRRRVVVAAE
jgi:hypothetical protein